MLIKRLEKCLVFLLALCFLACGNNNVAQTETFSSNQGSNVDKDAEEETSNEVSVWKRECLLRDSLRSVSSSLYFKHLDNYNKDSNDIRSNFGDFELENICHAGDLKDADDSYKMKFANFVAHKQLNSNYHLVQYSNNFREECISYVFFIVLDNNLNVIDNLSFGVDCPDEEGFDSAPECLIDSIGEYKYLWYSQKDNTINLGDSLELTSTSGYLVKNTTSSQMYKYEKVIKQIYKVDESGHFYQVGKADPFDADVMLKEMKKY